MADINEQPKMLDLEVVLQMFREIKDEIKKTNSEVQLNSKKISKTIRRTDEDYSEVKQLRKQVQSLQSHTELLMGVVQNMAQRLEESKKKFIQLEWNNMKDSVVVTGFCASNKKDIAISQMHNLLTEEMEVDLEITDMYPIGGGTPRPYVVTFASRQSKKCNYCRLKRNYKI